MFKKVVLYISVIFLVNTVFGSPTTTITLQQGVGGYEGFSWIKMLGPSSPGAGNNKYLYKFIFGQMLTALYEC